MKDAYTTERGPHDFIDYELDEPFPAEPYKTEQEGAPFHIGQSYRDTPAPKLVCVSCGGDKFIVGSHDYCTVIKCPVCLWEREIHNG